MLIKIEICDDGEGTADINVVFDPDLSDETRATPAARVALQMLAAVADYFIDMEVEPGKDENQFEMFPEEATVQ